MSLRAGARRYARLLSLPGARAPVLASAAGSLPIGMYGLAIILLARDATGSYAAAGRVVGAFGLANAFGAVAQGRLMDRMGQPRVLRAAAAGHVLALAGLLVAAGREAPAWVLAACAVGAGLCVPQLPGAMRSLWGTIGGIVYGARDWPGAPPRRLVVLMLVLGAAYAVLAAARTPWLLGGLLLLPGLLLAPTNVVSSTLLDTVAPPGTMTEAFAVTVMAVVSGIALGNAAGGLIVDGASYELAVLCSGAAAVAGAAAALLRRGSLTTPRSAPAGR